MNGVPGKRVRDVLNGQVESAQARFFSSLGGDGEAVINAMNAGGYLETISAYLRTGGWYKESDSVLAYRQIMGKNFLGFPEALKAWGARIICDPSFTVPLDDLVIRDGVGQPISTGLTELVCRKAAQHDSHVLVYYPGVSSKLLGNICDQNFLETTTIECASGWYLISKQLYPNSLNKSWEQQICLIDPTVDAVTYRVVVMYALILDHVLGRLFNQEGYVDYWGRCLDTVPEKGNRHALSGKCSRMNEAHAKLYESTTDEANPRVGLATIKIGL